MSGFGLPAPMFWVFAATILVGSLGAIHYLIAHVWLGRPFQVVPPPVVREGRLSDDGLEGGGGGGGSEGRDGEEGGEVGDRGSS